MAKPLICELDIRTVRRNQETEQKGYLEKYISESMLYKSFQNLVDYMLDIEIDDLNPLPYSSEQKNLVKTIKQWYIEVAQQQGSEEELSIDIMAQNFIDPTNQREHYDPRAIVADHLEKIARVKHVKEGEEEIPYQCIDLILKKSYVMGFRFIPIQNNEIQQYGRLHK